VVKSRTEKERKKQALSDGEKIESGMWFLSKDMGKSLFRCKYRSEQKIRARVQPNFNQNFDKVL